MLLGLLPPSVNAAPIDYEDVPSVFSAWPAAGHVVALTFDDGYNAANVDRIRGILESEHVRATFFPTSNAVLKSPATWRRVAAAGFPIGNHTADHPDLVNVPYTEVVDQFTRSRRSVEQVIGRPTIPYARPPYGSVNRTVIRAAGAAGFRALVNWDTDTLDWRDGTELVVERGVSGHDGSIVLMHERASTVEALPLIIASYRERGFGFVTVPELLRGAAPRISNGLYRVVNLRTTGATTPAVDVYVDSNEAQSLVRGGLRYGRRTTYFTLPPNGRVGVTAARARPICTWTCGFVAFTPATAEPTRRTIVVHETGFVELVEAGATEAGSQSASTIVLSEPSPMKVNLYVLAVGLANANDGVRIRRVGRNGCIATSDGADSVIRGLEVVDLLLPIGTSYVTLHASSDTTCSAAPVGGPFSVTAPAGSRRYLMPYGAPGAMGAKVVPIPAP